MLSEGPQNVLWVLLSPPAGLGSASPCLPHLTCGADLQLFLGPVKSFAEEPWSTGIKGGHRGVMAFVGHRDLPSWTQAIRGTETELSL